MNVTEIDGQLGRLRRAADQVSSNLLELERDANRELVDAASLEGVSAKRWEDAKRELSQVWQWHKLLIAFLDEAGKRRGTRSHLSADQERALATYLSGPSIELKRDEIPIAERPLVGPATMTTRCTADELLAHMAAAFESGRDVLFSIGAAWDAMVTRVRDAREELTVVRGTADAAHGAHSSVTIDALQSRLDLLAETLVLDPLAVDPEDLDSIETRIGELASELLAAAELRDELDARVARAHALLEELTAAIDEAHEAHREVIAKVAGVAVPNPNTLVAAPSTGLDAVELLAAEGRWTEADAALRGWITGAEEQLVAARACGEANRAPIESRNQLRSLLDAYRSRARRLGLAEDETLGSLYAEARDLLYTAPLDLAIGERAVRTYRDALPHDESDRKATR